MTMARSPKFTRSKMQGESAEHGRENARSSYRRQLLHEIARHHVARDCARERITRREAGDPVSGA
jgi:hypothetical protein